MDFTYKAKNQKGQIIESKITAESEKQAINALQKQNLFVLDLEGERNLNIKNIGSFKFKRKVSLKDKIVFTKQLAIMVKSGLPLVEALKALEEQTENPIFIKAIGEIIKDVQGGLALSKALAKHPKIFPPLYISVTASGERSGKIDEVLERLSQQLQKDYDLISKVKSAVTYPVVIVCALIGVLVLLIVFVVPELKKIFDEMGVALPLTTRILLGSSDFIIKYWYIVIAFITGVILAIKAWAKTSTGGLMIDKFKIKAPIFGKVVQKIYLARFSRTTATLIASGLPMLEILSTVKEVVGNKVYRPMFDQISDAVESGVPLSLALKNQKIFPVMISQMVSVGEKSGKIDEILFGIADFYDKEVEASTASLASLIEPILIIVIGAGIGVAIASVIMPIYSLVNVI